MESKKVLVIHDDPRIAGTCSFILSTDGYRVDHAATGCAAILAMEGALRQGDPYGLVICSVKYLGRDEFVAYRAQSLPDTPLIAMTGNTSEGGISLIKNETGAAEVVATPFTIKTLEDTVQRHYPKG